VLVLDVEIRGECADRRWTLCPLRQQFHRQSSARRDNGARVVFAVTIDCHDRYSARMTLLSARCASTLQAMANKDSLM